jgi:hypothetical protein
MIIDFYTSYFNAPNERRASELKKAILANCESRLFRKVYVIHDAKCRKDIEHPLLQWVYLEWRPHYDDFFRLVNYMTDSETINAIGNTDIVFDPSIYFLENIDLTDTIVELSRYEPDGRIKNYGEDIWIWKGKIKPNVWANLPLGELGCDYRITYELRKAGYKVVNPSLDVTTWHVHESNIRYYANQNKWYPHGDNHTKPTKIAMI